MKEDVETFWKITVPKKSMKEFEVAITHSLKDMRLTSFKSKSPVGASTHFEFSTLASLTNQSAIEQKVMIAFGITESIERLELRKEEVKIWMK